jgi:hypothetical protein
MKIVATNKDVFNYLTEEKSILSGQILSFYIWNFEEKVNCEIKIEINRCNKTTIFILRFIDIDEYSLYYKNIFYFYNISRLKFFFDNVTERFYISLDPFDESEKISIEDQDFILGKGIELLVDS